MKFLALLFVLTLFGFSQTQAQQNSDQNSAEASVESNVEDQEATNEELPVAQETEDPTPSGVEKIEVTGSHIKRIDVEGPSPVLVIDQEDLVRSGYNSVSDVLRDQGVSSFGGFREHAGQVGAGTSAVDLRGLGQVRTLILLNGRRLPTDAISGSVDLNIIPMAAVERVEVLKDGASAIYGSDALGGVVNIITKKDFSGHELGLGFSVAEMPGGGRRDISHTYGYNSTNWSMINVLYFRHNERILAKDRPWSEIGYSSTGDPGSYSVSGDSAFKPDPRCPAEDQINGRCYYKFSDQSWEMPYINQGAWLNEIRYDINESLQAITRVSFSRKTTDWQTAPAGGGFFDSASDPFTFTGPSELAPNGDNGATIDGLIYRFSELGLRKSHTDTDAGMAVAGVKGYFLDTWSWESFISFNKVDRTEIRRGYALTADLKNAITNTQYNPFGAPGQKGDLSQYLYEPRFHSFSENSFLEAKTSGELGDLAAGPVSMAIGVQALRELYQDNPDAQTLAGNVFGVASSAGGGARDSYSLFTEFNFQWLQNLENNLAIRYDHFEGFGDTVNPKVGFRYLPWKELMFRASAGTGFKAPQMQMLYASRTSGNSTFVDQVYCDANGGTGAPCTSQQHPIVQGGNPNLREETSFSYNIGTVIQPDKHHSIAIDHWYYKLEDVVSTTDFAAATQLEAQGVDMSQFGVVAERDPVTKQLINSGLYGPFSNVSIIETQGLDFTYNGKFPTSVGDFKVQFQHSHMFEFKTEPFPTLGIRDRLGINLKPRWRNNGTLFWIPNPNHEFSILARTIAGHSKRTASRGRLPTYSEFDLRYNWSIESLNSKLTVGIRNVLGTIPPYDDSNAIDPDINFQLYNERGRQLFLGYRQAF